MGDIFTDKINRQRNEKHLHFEQEASLLCCEESRTSQHCDFLKV